MAADQIVALSRGDFRPKICIGMLFERFEITYHLYEQVVVIIARYMIIKVFLIVSRTVFYLAAMAGGRGRGILWLIFNWLHRISRGCLRFGFYI